jgi:thymidylate kinase
VHTNRYEKTDFQKAVAAKFATLEGIGNWQQVDAARSIEEVHVRLIAELAYC